MNTSVHKKDLQKAADLLTQGEVVAIPTETVYGLAARIDNEQALKKIFEVKERPLFDPLIVHVSGVPMARTLVKKWPPIIDHLTKNFWPGPLTIVLSKNEQVNSLITSGLDSVGLRCPNHPLTLELIQNLNVPLAAPSANKFGKTSPTRPSHVKNEFGDNVFILDGGESQVGIESTIVGVQFENEKITLQIYRLGMISQSDMERVIPANFSYTFLPFHNNPVAPGHLKHHYMPNIPVILLSSVAARKNKKFQNLIKDKKTIELKLDSSPSLAARELYHKMRQAAEDHSQPDYLIHQRDEKAKDEHWEAIYERLQKASTYHF